MCYVIFYKSITFIVYITWKFKLNVFQVNVFTTWMYPNAVLFYHFLKQQLPWNILAVQ